MNQRALHHDVTTSPETAAQVSADGTIRLTAAQAVVRYLAAQRVETEDGTGTEPLFSVASHPRSTSSAGPASVWSGTTTSTPDAPSRVR